MEQPYKRTHVQKATCTETGANGESLMPRSQGSSKHTNQDSDQTQVQDKVEDNEHGIWIWMIACGHKKANDIKSNIDGVRCQERQLEEGEQLAKQTNKNRASRQKISLSVLSIVHVNHM